MKNEEMEAQIMHMRNAIISLQEYLAPKLKTRDIAILKYGLTANKISQLDGYFAEIFIKNLKPTKEEFREKMTEIREIHVTNEILEDILLSYKADNLHTKIINNVLK